MIFSDTAKILDADMIDIDADERNDIVITYKDGSVRLLKNYGGGDPFMDLGTLMVIADGVKQVFPGDVDGNGYDDLTVLTADDRLRTYTNTDGVFDVHGTIVCLDIPLGHKNVGQVRQLFGEDIDGDGRMDIVTNDMNGDIKVFYGGSSNGGPISLSLSGNLLSSNDGNTPSTSPTLSIS